MSIELNPAQFKNHPSQYKVDLGTDLNVEHEYALADREHVESRNALIAAKKMPGVGTPEPGYYDQPSNKHRQMALPGMEMSVQDHLDALGARTGTTAEVYTEDGEHQMSLTPHHRENPWDMGSYLVWNDRRGQRPTKVRPGVRTMTLPGEIQMVKSTQRGDASAMLDTAEKLAHEHGYTFPKHSESRMPDGVQWSQAMMRRRGERVW